MAGPPLAQINSESAPESTDDYLSGLQMDREDFGELHLDQEESTSKEEKNLDDYLDQLLEEDEPDEEILDESAPQPNENSTSLASDMPSEDDLDRLFDSLIAEEIKSPIAQEHSTPSDLSPENEPEEKDLDALLDEILLNNLDDEDAVEPKADFDETESTLLDSEPLPKDNEEIDKSVSDSMENIEQKIEPQDPEKSLAEADSSDNRDEEDPLEKDAIAEAPAEEKTLSTVNPPEDSTEASQAPQETADSEPSADQPEEEKSDEDLWAEAFADQEALKESDQDGDRETPSEEAPKAVDQNEENSAQETTEADGPADQPEEEKSDEDLWADAFADQEALKESDQDGDAESQSEEAPKAVDQNEEKGAQETTEADGPADQPEEEMVAETAEMDSDEETSSAQEEAGADAEEDPEEEPEDEPERNEFGLSEADYEDEDDGLGDQFDEFAEDEEESSSSKKKKFAFLTLPSTKTGKLVLGGSVLAVLLTGGGAYFALQTLAPPELTQMSKNTSEVPEGLKPKDSNPALQNPAGNAPIEKPNPALAAALGKGNIPPLAKDTGNLDTPPVDSGSGTSEGLMAALAPSNNAVQLGTIMPVAYNINDIRVLSFSLEAEMSDAKSAQVIREAMPVFEKITITTVEQLMDKKFFNDILYVKEKLKKNLQNNFNKTLEGGGRVKKITFREFTVQ